ncbi:MULTISPECIES: phosphotransferase [unclassified Nocardioides]|uniref:phosphotransferase n=1 Tax=unclassified Nocardioides TaxID=2615069 RepID=UPI0006FC8E50|nr:MULTISPECIES: phosphotransferase [unclassified Nocardioides]KQY64375.1 phosphotransferase [Nocardioides sp. Root140]KQZ70290.1 phosphotransferase [Nocardioides sp. Root151]KRF18146.1 phosphotransferase [Nocardioides sp. Soil796]
MWQPEPGWQPVPGGMGTSTVGVWRCGDQVVKRLQAPLPGDPGELSDRSHFAWWRRPAEVATSGVVDETPGLRSVRAAKVEEDDEGITLWHAYVESETLPGPFVARALGRFAGADLPAYPWLARRQLATRLARVEHNGGWRTLERTTVADVADRLWQLRGQHLDVLDGLPEVAQHGDPAAANLIARDGDDVVAIDWSMLGIGPVGADLGYLALTAREDFDVLVDAYADGLPAGIATRAQVLLGARINAVHTAMSRAEWALARVADGPGALAGKYRHPSVAPYLRSLQRLFPQIEALL